MKKIITSILLVLLTINGFAQSEIPLNKGRAYFSFKNTIESQKNCGSMFFDPSKSAEYSLLLQKNAVLVSQYFLNNSAFSGFGVTCFSILQNQKQNLQCADEVRLMPNSYKFDIKVSARKKKATLKILNDEITLKYPYGTTTLEINAKIIFKNKTEYELIFSDAFLCYAHIPKGERMPKSYRVELGEFYTAYKNSGETYPDNELLFNTLILTIENANKSLNQALQECVNFYE